MKKIKIFLPIFLALVMCVTSIRPVCAASGADTEPTYYYNDNYDTQDDLGGLSFDKTKVTGTWKSDGKGNGYVQLQRSAANQSGNITSFLTGAESKSMLIEMDLATTEAGMPESRFRILEKDQSGSYELFYIQGDSIYKSKNEATNNKNAIATIPADGTFTKFRVALTIDNAGIITSVDIYQYTNGSWVHKGSNKDTGANAPVEKTLKNPLNVNIQIRTGASTDETLLIDNLKVYPYVVAQIGNQNYATLQEAIAAAAAGDTITLRESIVYTGDLTIGENITLDLNGKTLTASTVATFGGTVVDKSSDKTGLLKVAENNAVFSTTTNNPQMPVYNGADGYVFADIAKQEQRNSDEGADTFELVFRPSLGTSTVVNNTLLASGGDAAKITIGIRLEGKYADGNDFEPIILEYDDAMIYEVYNSEDGALKAFYIKASGVNSFKDVKITPFVQSQLNDSIVWNGTTFEAN